MGSRIIRLLLRISVLFPAMGIMAVSGVGVASAEEAASSDDAINMKVEEYCFYVEPNSGYIYYDPRLGGVGEPPSLALYKSCDRTKVLVARVP